MAITGTCQYEIKEHIDHYVETGLTKTEASKKIAAEFEKIDIKIKPETVRKKGQRASEKLGTNVPTCKRCKKNQVKKSPSTKKPMDHGLCQNCRSADLKKEKAKPKNTKNGKVIKVHKPSEEYWEEIISTMDDFLMKPVVGAVGKTVLGKVFKMRDAMNQRIGELEKMSAP